VYFPIFLEKSIGGQGADMSVKIRNFLLMLSAVSAGLCNSLIGAGGGILMSFSLSRLAGEDFPDKRNIYSNSQAAMIPGCALSCFIYSMRGSLDLSVSPYVALPAALGGLIGSLLLPKIKLGWLKGAFALLVIWSGYRMMIA
jgi:uncharacterized membrane protein YfcA